MPERPPKPEGSESRPRFRKRHSSEASEQDRIKFTELLTKVSDAAKRGMPFADRSLDDRTVAILAGTFLDEFLRLAILTRGGRSPSKRTDRAVFKSNGGALSTFANRIWLTDMFGIINEAMFKDLQSIKWIRNEFAHSLEARAFADADIAKECAKLVGTFRTFGKTMPPETEPRKRFVDCALALSYELLNAMEESLVLWAFIFKNKDALDREISAVNKAFAEWMADQSKE